jgi:hypothetical protein
MGTGLHFDRKCDTYSCYIRTQILGIKIYCNISRILSNSTQKIELAANGMSYDLLAKPVRLVCTTFRVRLYGAFCVVHLNRVTSHSTSILAALFDCQSIIVPFIQAHTEILHLVNALGGSCEVSVPSYNWVLNEVLALKLNFLRKLCTCLKRTLKNYLETSQYNIEKKLIFWVTIFVSF